MRVAASDRYLIVDGFPAERSRLHVAYPALRFLLRVGPHPMQPRAAAQRSEYLGAERIVYGEIEGAETRQIITAKLPPAHVAEESIRPGEWHPYAVRNSTVRYFDKDGKRVSRH